MLRNTPVFSFFFSRCFSSSSSILVTKTCLSSASQSPACRLFFFERKGSGLYLRDHNFTMMWRGTAYMVASCCLMNVRNSILLRKGHSKDSIVLRPPKCFRVALLESSTLCLLHKIQTQFLQAREWICFFWDIKYKNYSWKGTFLFLPAAWILTLISFSHEFKWICCFCSDFQSVSFALNRKVWCLSSDSF